MSKYVILLLLLVHSMYADMYWADDYKSGIKEAAQKQKKVLILFSKEDCVKCEEILWTISFDKNVSDYVNENFVAIEIDIEYDKREGYKVYKTPTIYFLDANTKQIGKPFTEMLGPQGFLKKLKEIEKTEK